MATMKSNFPESATLEEYLCYTGDDDHNAMVSRFFKCCEKRAERPSGVASRVGR